MITMNNKKKIYLIAILAFFGIIYFLVSVVPHINFQTNAFDLGIFNQAIKQYANFQIGPNTVRSVPSLFADHFEGTMFLFAPLYWIFGSYTLLLVQIGSILLGSFGVYLLVKKESKNNQSIALVGTVVFLLFFGIFTALAFDYHNNVIGTMLIPWLLYFMASRKIKAYYLILALFLLSKENMALITILLGISIMIFDDKKIKKHGAITLLVSLLYFFISLKTIEYLNGSYDHWPYMALGESPIEALKFILLHPIQTLFLLFDDPIKIKMWVLILVSGGALALLKPKYFILLLPVIGQKFFADEPAFWGYTFHYSVEFAPVIAIGSVLFLSTLKNTRVRSISLSLLVLINIAILTQVNFYNGETIFRIFDSNYYEMSNRESLEIAINQIEDAESISAQNTIVPHLKNDRIYLLPQIEDSDYVILNVEDTNIWPFEGKHDLINQIVELEENPLYEEVYSSQGVHLFKSVER